MENHNVEKTRYGLFIAAIACYMLFVLCFVIWSMNQERGRLYADIDTRLLLAAKSLKHIVAYDFHDRALGPQSISLEEEMVNREKISEYARETSFEYLYTLVEKDGNYYFAAPTVTEEEAKEQLSWYFYPYEDIPESFVKAFRSGKTVFTSYHDQWGNFRSVAIPETSPGGRRYLACADYDISYINGLLMKEMIRSLVTAGLFLLFSLPFTLLYRKLYNSFRQNNNELISHKQNLETLVDERTHDLMEAKEAAEAADRAKSDFLAQMSHEIRTPLHSIIGSTEVLRETELTQEQQNMVELCLTNGEHLGELLNDVLDLAKIEAEHMVLQDEVINIRKLVEDMAESISPEARKAGLEFHLEIDESLPSMVRGDSTRIRQILFNIASNAVKFTHQGHVLLRAEAANTLANPDETPDATHGGPTSMIFTISDTGIGIAEEKLDDIFENFMQAETGSTRTYNGTGLGLTISRKLTLLMGGTIEVQSTVGKGTAFTVTLPMRIPGEVLPDAQPVRRDSGPLRVLVVDDAKENRLLMELYLKNTHHEAVAAENGRDALEIFINDRFDLIFMDISMPVMDGYAAISAIRSMEKERGVPHVCAFALTAHSRQEEGDRYLQAGFNGFLTKPVRKAAILEVINAVAEAKRTGADSPCGTIGENCQAEGTCVVSPESGGKNGK